MKDTVVSDDKSSRVGVGVGHVGRTAQFLAVGMLNFTCQCERVKRLEPVD